MISESITLLALEEIVPEWDKRRDIDEEHVDILAASIAANDLIHTLVVEEESNILCIGGHRLRAWIKNKENKVPCPNPAYLDWSFIPVRYAKDYTELELLRIELIENVQHKNITWQEYCLEVDKINSLHQGVDSKWTATDTAELLNDSVHTVQRSVKAAAYIKAGDPQVMSCDTLGSATNVIKRKEERQKATILEGLVNKVTLPGQEKVESPKGSAEPVEAPKPVDESPILLESFHDFATNYSGPRFNFLHCDFPYGLNISEHDGMRSVKDANKYDDRPEVYWELLNTLAQNKTKLLTSSCHIIFWFSQNFRRETEDFFAKHMPEFTVQKFLMIWHRDDSSGLCPDPERYGRRNLETAMLLTSGDRKIVRVKNLVMGFPGRDSNRLHKSEKPYPVVKHFLEMFIDNHSVVLDPTAGSGTALRAAYSLGADKVVGLEIDEEMQKAASREFKKHKEAHDQLRGLVR